MIGLTRHHKIDTDLQYMPKKSPFEVTGKITEISIVIHKDSINIVYEVEIDGEHTFVDGDTFREI